MGTNEPERARAEHDINSAETVRATLRGLEALGLDAPLPFASAEALPRASYCALWERSAARLGSEDIGLRVASAMPAGALGLLEWLCTSAPTIGEGLAALAAHGALLHTGGSYALAYEGSHMRFSYRAPHAARTPRPTIDWSFAYLLRSMRRALGEAPPVSAVHLEYARPSCTRALEETFCVAPSFGAERNELVLDRELASVHMPFADAEAHESLRAVAARRLSAGAGQGARARCLRAVQALLRRGEPPEIEAVACALGTSVRSLQRALGDEGTCFRHVLADARRELAELWIERGRTVKEVAFDLGYADVSSLHRALRAERQRAD